MVAVRIMLGMSRAISPKKDPWWRKCTEGVLETMQMDETTRSKEGKNKVVRGRRWVQCFCSTTKKTEVKAGHNNNYRNNYMSTG